MTEVSLPVIPSDLQNRVMRAMFSDEDGPGVFISYYPQDSRNVTGHIQAWFVLRYGAARVFTSAEIPPFVESMEYYIREKLRTCRVLVVVIGPYWEQTLFSRQQQGIEDDVRLAIRVALEDGKALIPICLEGVALPRAIDLPLDLRPLLDYPYIRIEPGHSFERDVRQVIDALDQETVQPHAMSRLADFEDLYQLFQQAYAAQDWPVALDYLQQIQAVAEIPRPLKSQLVQSLRRVQTELRRAEARPIYAEVCHLVIADPARGWDALQLFLAEYPEHGDPANLAGQIRPLPPDVQAWVEQATDPRAALSDRIAAAEELAWYGDPRPGVGLRADGLPDIAWARIPAGHFIYHYDQRLTLPTFYLARYTVTQAQFQVFIDEGGYQDDRWWSGLAQREVNPPPPAWEIPNYPRGRISWYDAVAFCRWLSDRLGYPVRLPTEYEWEKAARGTDGRIYPWGNRYKAGYANINEVTSGVGSSNLRSPTPVGIYPQAASRYGIYDLIGNVWEWCLRPEHDTAQPDLSSTAKRALRGGSCFSEWMFAHTARRRTHPPSSRFPDFGFRLACDALPPIAT